MKDVLDSFAGRNVIVFIDRGEGSSLDSNPVGRAVALKDQKDGATYLRVRLDKPTSFKYEGKSFDVIDVAIRRRFTYPGWFRRVVFVEVWSTFGTSESNTFDSRKEIILAVGELRVERRGGHRGRIV